MFVVPVHTGLKDDLRTVCEEYHVLCERRACGELIGAAETRLTAAHADTGTAEQFGGRLEAVFDRVRVHIPVIPVGRNVLGQHKGAKRQTGAHFSAHALVKERGETAVFVPCHAIERSFQTVVCHRKDGVGHRVQVAVFQGTGLHRRKAHTLNRGYGLTKDVFKGLSPCRCGKWQVNRVIACKSKRVVYSHTLARGIHDRVLLLLGIRDHAVHLGNALLVYTRDRAAG